MLVEKITSRQNPLVKRLRQVRDGLERHHIFLEGVRVIEEALNAGVHFETVAYSSNLETTERGLALLDRLGSVQCRGALVSEQVMEAIAHTESPQGVVALVTRPHYDLDLLFEPSPALLIIADGLQDPGNLGTIIRTAEAAGATGLIATRHTVDPFNVKSLRASAGSALRLPIAVDAKLSDVLERCRNGSIRLLASRPQRPGLQEAETASKRYDSVDLTGSLALMVGREAAGVSEDAAASADQIVYIPMKAEVESLNVATAAAILLYEAARQREFSFS